MTGCRRSCRMSRKTCSPPAIAINAGNCSARPTPRSVRPQWSVRLLLIGMQKAAAQRRAFRRRRERFGLGWWGGNFPQRPINAMRPSPAVEPLRRQSAAYKNAAGPEYAGLGRRGLLQCGSGCSISKCAANVAHSRRPELTSAAPVADRGHERLNWADCASRRPRPRGRPRTGMEGAVARSRPSATGAHPLPSRRLARAHRRRTGRDQTFQMRPCRAAVPRPPGSSPAASPVQIRTKTPRPPTA